MKVGLQIVALNEVKLVEIILYLKLNDVKLVYFFYI